MGAVTISARRRAGATRTLALAAVCAAFCVAPAAAASWSAPASAPCPATGPPLVLFPSDKPSEPTGPGALLWPGAAACPGGAGARVQAIAAGATPSAPARPRSASGALIAPAGPIAAASSPHGQIAISGADPRNPSGELLVQGRSDGRFRALLKGGPLTAPGVLATAYLGDLALLAPLSGGGGAMAVRIERWFANGLGAQLPAAPRAAGTITAATIAMDFRSDAIAAWARRGSVWVADLPAHGRLRPPRRLGPAGSLTRIVALLSDDGRGMVMWSASAGASTSVWLDYSQAGPRFGAPQLLERYSDPGAGAPPAGSPRLIRLSSESVMSAWAGVEGGRWVVRTAPIDQRGLRTVSTLAAPSGDALLEALAPGPDGDAIALLGEPLGALPAIETLSGGPPSDPAGDQVLVAARGTEAAGRTLFAAPEPVATIPAASLATLAIEPGTDRAIAAWQGPGGVVEYSVRTSGNGG